MGELGKLLLMFFAGLEIDLALFRRVRNRSIAFGLATTTIPLALGTAAGFAFGYTAVPAIYAGRVGTGMTDKVLTDLRRRPEPLARASMPLSAPPPRKTRFGSPLVLSRVHWVGPQLVAKLPI